MIKRFSLITLLIFGYSCKQDHTQEFLDTQTNIIAGNNTYGHVDRNFPEDNRNGFYYPLNVIGILDIPQGTRYCTASLIGGQHIITASHCVMDREQKNMLKGNYTFRLNVKRNNAHSASYKITKFYFTELKKYESINDAKNHWVIMKLDRDTGLYAQSFAISYPGHTKYDENHFTNSDVKTAGYSTQLNGNSWALTYNKDNCDILEHFDDHHAGYHDCDNGPGDSGAPIYKCMTKEDGKYICYISAIHIAAKYPWNESLPKEGMHRLNKYDREYANVATLLKSFYWYAHYIVQKEEKNKENASLEEHIRSGKLQIQYNN